VPRAPAGPPRLLHRDLPAPACVQIPRSHHAVTERAQDVCACLQTSSNEAIVPHRCICKAAGRIATLAEA
jgi:hypothetical protein